MLKLISMLGKPPAFQVGGPVPATGIPRRAGDSPEQSPRPNATNSLGCDVQGARKEAEEARLYMEVVSQNQELQTLISSHLLMRLRT